MITTYKQLKNRANTFFGPFVYGAIDGTVTTFAVVASSYGANLPSRVVLILGFANLIGDGFSMGASAYASGLSERQQQARAMEVYSTDRLATEQKVRQSISHHFVKDYGFDGELLESALNVAMSREDRIVKHLLRDQFGVEHVHASRREAFSVALATFVAFLAVGIIPLLPYLYSLVNDMTRASVFMWSMIMTIVSFMLVGYLKGRVTVTNRWRATLETVLLGGIAALIAYGVGDVLANWLI